MSALHFVDLPTGNFAVGSMIEWTFHWLEDDRWEGGNFRAEIV